jgi:hypothetical protein
MADLRRKLEDTIIAARRATDSRKLMVLTFAKDRMIEAEKSAFKLCVNPTISEIQNKRKLLTLEQEAAVIKHLIGSYETELEGLKRMKVQAKEQYLERNNKIDWLGDLLSDFRAPDLESTVLDFVIQNNYNKPDQLNTAVVSFKNIYPFEDLRVVRAILIKILC